VWGPSFLAVFILADTSRNDRGIAGYNRIRNAIRPHLEVSKAHDLLAIKHYGPKFVDKFKAEDMYERWLLVISKGTGATSSAKRQNLVELFRKFMSEAQNKF
jgi:hypothetical protein